MKIITVLFLAAAVVIIAACQSTPEEIPADLQPREYFQKAQEAVVERNDYDTALFYYKVFLERYPEDLQRTVEAEYEVAFIHYKQNDLETAERLFTALLARYEGEGAVLLPQWPRTLAEKVLDKIQNSPAN